VFTLERLATGVGLIITGAIAGVTDEISQTLLRRRDFLEQTGLLDNNSPRTSVSSWVVHGDSSSRTAGRFLATGFTAFLAGAAFFTAFLAGAAF
jgi:hypothetical protein